MDLQYLILKALVPFLMFISGERPFENHASGGDPAFTLHYTVDRMTHEKIISGKLPDNYLEPLPKSVRYSMTYQVRNDGDFFLEIFMLDSPWETKLPHEVDIPEEQNISRMLVKPGFFQAFDETGNLLHQQTIEDLSMPAGLFGDGFDPLALRELLLTEENPTNRKLMLTEKGGIELENGYISIQSCGQNGPLQINCDPGVCSRIIYDSRTIRPILAEHSKVGEPPFYVQYMRWSKDGRALERSFEREVFQSDDGLVKALETVSHYYNFSMKK